MRLLEVLNDMWDVYVEPEVTRALELSAGEFRIPQRAAVLVDFAILLEPGCTANFQEYGSGIVSVLSSRIASILGVLLPGGNN
jgi:hypothetical protein